MLFRSCERRERTFKDLPLSRTLRNGRRSPLEIDSRPRIAPPSRWIARLVALRRLRPRSHSGDRPLTDPDFTFLAPLPRIALCPNEGSITENGHEVTVWLKKTVRSKSKALLLKRYRMQCFELSSPMDTRSWHTSAARCDRTTFASFPKIV